MKSFNFDSIRNKYFIPKPFSSLPYTLNLNRVFVFPTKYGFLFLIVLSVMLIGSVNYNNNLGFLLTFLLGSMAFISMFYTYANMAGIKFLSFKTKPVFVNDMAVIEYFIEVSDKKRFGIEVGFSKNQTLSYDLMLSSDNRVQAKILTMKRGILKPGPLLILTNYPLGLFCAWSWINLDVNCMVYPKPIAGPIESVNDLSTDKEGIKEGPGVDDFNELKPYQPGDSLKRIHWKSFSRGQGLFTKTFMGQFGSSVLLDLDRVKGKELEYRLSRLCDMILKINKLNAVYGLKLPGTEITPYNGEMHKHECLKALALFGIKNE